MSRLRYLVLLPLVVILAVVEVYPLLDSFYFSIINYNQGGVLVGAANYVQLFSDPKVYAAIGVSFAYAVGSTLFAIGIGLVLAFLVTGIRRGRGFLESFFLIPLAAAPITTGIIWNPEGFWDDINTFLHFILHLPYIDLNSIYVAFPIIILSDAWEWAPIMMLVALSVVYSIPKEVFEAASLHGASDLQIFSRITVPTVLKSRVMQFMIVLRFVDAMRAFEIPFAWSSWLSLPNAGSPIDTVSLLIYKLLLIPTYNFPLSYISALALVLLILTFSATTVLYALMKRLDKI